MNPERMVQIKRCKYHVKPTSIYKAKLVEFGVVCDRHFYQWACLPEALQRGPKWPWTQGLWVLNETSWKWCRRSACSQLNSENTAQLLLLERGYVGHIPGTINQVNIIDQTYAHVILRSSLLFCTCHNFNSQNRLIPLAIIQKTQHS